jgi:peptidoglycan/xylan/chitin deacetylase (PgdA/CDA1 family)
MLIKAIIWFLVRFSGIPLLLREVIYKEKVAIIIYHDPKPETFQKHVKYLSKRYNIIPLSRLVGAIEKEDWSDIPPKALIITIDDGHKGNYKLLDIFKTYNIYPTIYICSHIVNTNRHFWWKTGYPNYQGLKKLPHDVTLKTLQEEAGYWPDREYSERQTLNMSELVEMLHYVDFQSHTKYHPILINCENETSLDEIENSKILIGKM